MSNYRKIPIAGGLTSQSAISASLGSFFARALLKQKGDVTILGRASAVNSQAAKELASSGAKIVEVDYTDPSSLEKALHGIDVVISTLAGAGFEQQLPLAKASKAAGVKLFVPSEFGNDTTTLEPDNPLWGKTALQAELRNLELPYLLLFNGFFMDWVVPVALEVKDNEIIIIGEGKADISFTTRDDVASFLSYILLNLPPSRLEGATFPIEGSRTNLLALSDLLLAKNPNATVVHKSHEWALKRFVQEGDFVAWLKVMWDKGEGDVGDKLANGVFEGWNPKKVREFF